MGLLHLDGRQVAGVMTRCGDRITHGAMLNRIYVNANRYAFCMTALQDGCTAIESYKIYHGLEKSESPWIRIRRAIKSRLRL